MARQVEHMKEKKKTQKEILLENAEEVIEMIENNRSYKEISERYKVRVENVFLFVNESEYSARARRAMQIASYNLLDKAQEAIESIEDTSTHARVARQRELKNIYLYRAQIKNRKELDLNYKEKEDTTQQIVIVPADYMNQKK